MDSSHLVLSNIEYSVSISGVNGSIYVSQGNHLSIHSGLNTTTKIAKDIDCSKLYFESELIGFNEIKNMTVQYSYVTEFILHKIKLDSLPEDSYMVLLIELMYFHLTDFALFQYLQYSDDPARYPFPPKFQNIWSTKDFIDKMTQREKEAKN